MPQTPMKFRTIPNSARLPAAGSRGRVHDNPSRAAETFTYQSNGAGLDQMTALISWDEVISNQPPPSEPQLVGTALIETSSGDPSFATDDFPAGSIIDIGANFPLNGSCSLTQLATMTDCTAIFEFASFEGTPDALTPGLPGGPQGPQTPGVPVPEPMSSFMALGVALCCLWGTYRVVRRESGQSGPRFLHETSA
jgi:hypothetical protein